MTMLLFSSGIQDNDNQFITDHSKSVSLGAVGYFAGQFVLGGFERGLIKCV
mgnify:CR=1 FL=1